MTGEPVLLVMEVGLISIAEGTAVNIELHSMFNQ